MTDETRTVTPDTAPPRRWISLAAISTAAGLVWLAFYADLSYLLEKNDEIPGIRLMLGRDQGRPADLLEIDGGVTAEHAGELERAMWHHLPDLRPAARHARGHPTGRRPRPLTATRRDGAADAPGGVAGA